MKTALILLLAFVAVAVADNTHVVHDGNVYVTRPDSNGFMNEWLMLGPYPHGNIGCGHFASGVGLPTHLKGEEPTLGDSGPDGKSWEMYKGGPNGRTACGNACNGGFGVDMDCHFSGGTSITRSTAYSLAYVWAAEDMDVEIRAGSDDGLAIWVNDHKVHNHHACRCWGTDQDRVNASLKKGKNKILVAVSENGGHMGFVFRMRNKATNQFLSNVAVGFGEVAEVQIGLPELPTNGAKPRHFQLKNCESELRDGELRAPIIDEIENKVHNLIDRERDLNTRFNNEDKNWEDQVALNNGFEQQLDFLEESFDRIKTFRISTHHIHAYEGAFPDTYVLDVNLEIAVTGEPVTLDLTPEQGSTHTIEPATFTWGPGEEHTVAKFTFTGDLRGDLRTEVANGIFSSADKTFDGDNFQVFVEVTPPCSIRNGGCNHICAGTESGHYCVCMDGYRLDEADNHTCMNINECEEGLDDCHEEASCADIEGSFACTCKDGYRGDGHTAVAAATGCNDIDECAEATDSCPGHSTCENTAGSYECPCHDGFEHVDEANTHSACENINECTRGTHTCDIHADCHDEAPFYTCECHHSFRGDGETCYPYYEDVLASEEFQGVLTYDGYRYLAYLDPIKKILSSLTTERAFQNEVAMAGFGGFIATYAGFRFKGGNIVYQPIEAMGEFCLTRNGIIAPYVWAVDCSLADGEASGDPVAGTAVLGDQAIDHGSATGVMVFSPYDSAAVSPNQQFTIVSPEELQNIHQGALVNQFFIQ